MCKKKTKKKIVAGKIVADLDKRNAFRKSFPKHLDKDKFLHLVEKNVEDILEASCLE